MLPLVPRHVSLKTRQRDNALQPRPRQKESNTSDAASDDGGENTAAARGNFFGVYSSPGRLERAVGSCGTKSEKGVWCSKSEKGVWCSSHGYSCTSPQRLRSSPASQNSRAPEPKLDPYGVGKPAWGSPKGEIVGLRNERQRTRSGLPVAHVFPDPQQVLTLTH